MDHLRRDQAPLSTAAWERVDSEAARTLRHFLAGRTLIDFSGPKGWGHAAEALGRLRPTVPSPLEGVVAGIRETQPMVEMRTAFELALAEMDDIDRGAQDPDLSAVIAAARTAALAEDEAIFNGYDAGGIAGIGPSSPHEPVDIGEDYGQYPSVVAKATATLRLAGIGGPYAIALGSRIYTGVIETTEHGGYPVLEHIKLILGGPVIWAPAVEGAIVLSTRGGDYEMVCGEDFSIGYRSHAADTVELYIEESFTLLINEAAAAVALRHHD